MRITISTDRGTMSYRRRVLAAGCAVALGVVATGCEPPPSLWEAELVSVNAGGTSSGNDGSGHQFWGNPLADISVSEDGTKLVFVSRATDLVPLDTDSSLDIYIRDLTTGTTSLVSVNEDGTGGLPRDAYDPLISPDGTKVAFSATSASHALHDDLWVRDLEAGTTTLLIEENGLPNLTSWTHVDLTSEWSTDSSKLAFVTQSPHLTSSTCAWGSPGPGQMVSGHCAAVYVYDFAIGSAVHVSVPEDGSSGSGNSTHPTFDPDGTQVAFYSSRNLLPGITRPQVYVRDLADGSTSLVSANVDGSAGGNASSDQPVFSPDGTSVAFRSRATDLVPDPIPSSTVQVYVRDLADGSTSLVSANVDGSAGANGWSRAPVFSPDGKKVAFTSNSSDLVAASVTYWVDQMYVRDLVDGSTSLVSMNGEGSSAGDGASHEPRFSSDGANLAFVSEASDLGPTDTNGEEDVYVRDLVTGTTQLVSSNADGTDSGNRESLRPAFVGNGAHVAFVSEASDLGPTDTNGEEDVYLAALRGADLSIAVETAPEPVGPGEELTYNLVATNAGPLAAEDVTVALLPPEETDLVDAGAAGGSCAPDQEHPQVVVCQISDLPTDAAEEVEVTVTVEVNAPEGAALEALAYVSSPTGDPHRSNNLAGTESTVG